MSDRIRVAVHKVVVARRMAREFSPGDKAQSYLASQIEEGLDELAVALADETPRPVKSPQFILDGFAADLPPSAPGTSYPAEFEVGIEDEGVVVIRVRPISPPVTTLTREELGYVLRWNYVHNGEGLEPEAGSLEGRLAGRLWALGEKLGVTI